MRQQFAFQQTSLDGLILIEPFYVEDARGYFLKSFERQIFAAHGIQIDCWETFESLSAKGVIRGLHFQKKPWQDRLVRCLSGEIFDVAVDLRKDSKTYGQWEAFYLSGDNQRELYVPTGFAHGFLSLKKDTRMAYLCGDRHIPDMDGGIRWDDPDIGVAWPLDQLGGVPILSEKDQNLPFLQQVEGEW